MGVFTRPDSPWYWLFLERPGQRGIKERTRIQHEAATAEERRRLRALAEDAYRVRMSELARGTYELPGSRPDITLRAFADWYETHITARQAGADRERQILKRLRADLGACSLQAVTRDRVREWMTARAQQVAVSTVNRELDLLKSMLREATPKYLPASPLAKMRRLSAKTEAGAEEDDDTVRVLACHEEWRLYKALADPRDVVLVLAAIDTLARLSSLLALTWKDDRGSHLVFRRTKNGKTYRVPVSRRLRAALDAMPDRDDTFVFAHRRTTKDVGQRRTIIKNVLSRTCRRAGVAYGRKVGGITFHSFRHTGATRMLEAGVDLRTVQELGGWSDIRLLTRYLHPSSDRLRAAVETIGPGTGRE
jgi:integrase